MIEGAEYSDEHAGILRCYVSDGIERWATRGALRWRRPCWCADELEDLEAALIDVPDDSPGWEVIGV